MKLWILPVYLALLSVLVTPATAHAITGQVNTFSDCSEYVQLPTDWATKLVTDIKSANPSANPTYQWFITANINAEDISFPFISFWATPTSGNTRQPAAPIWYAQNTVDLRKINFNIASARGDVYRVIYPLLGNGSLGSPTVTYYNVAWAKTLTTQVTCAFQNQKMGAPINWANIGGVITAHSPVLQDTELGFLSPIPTAGTVGGSSSETPIVNVTSTGITRLEVKEILVKSAGFILAAFIAYKLILFFRWRP